MPTARCRVCGTDDAHELGGVYGKDALAFDCPRCGKYTIDVLASPTIDALAPGERFLLTGVVRASSDRGQPLELTVERVPALVASAPRRPALLEAIDRLLLLLAGRAPDYWSKVAVDKDRDYPLIYGRGEREMNYLLVKAGELGYLDPRGESITLAGWQRIDELRRTLPSSRKAFVAMWFAKEMDDAWLNGFKPGVEMNGYPRGHRASGAG
jgi:hypothetical protein